MMCEIFVVGKLAWGRQAFEIRRPGRDSAFRRSHGLHDSAPLVWANDHAPPCQPASRRRPGAFLAHLSHNFGHTCWCLRVLCRFGIALPRGRIAGWLATVTSLATRLSQLAQPDDSHGCIGFRSQARRGLNVEGSSTSICCRYQTRTCLHIE